MTKNTIKQRASAIASAIIMGMFGMTSFASADTITNTGPNSTNIIQEDIVSTCDVNNINTIDITQTNDQTATTGDAVVADNTTGGSATTGAAVNENMASFMANLSNDSGFIGPVLSPLVDPCGNTILPGSGGGGVINTTGPNSVNGVVSSAFFSSNRNNFNSVRAGFGNSQGARSGSAVVAANTHGGGAGSGPAQNNNGTAASVGVSNGPSGGAGGGGVPAPVFHPATISNTGPGSTNVIASSVFSSTNVNNSNTVSYSNSNTQSADSGSAIVADNTTGGSATTGTAANSNTARGSISVSN